jgi:hypothetical protein
MQEDRICPENDWADLQVINYGRLFLCFTRGEEAGREAAQYFGTRNFRGAFQYFDALFPNEQPNKAGRYPYRSAFAFAFCEALEKARQMQKIDDAWAAHETAQVSQG